MFVNTGKSSAHCSLPQHPFDLLVGDARVNSPAGARDCDAPKSDACGFYLPATNSGWKSIGLKVYCADGSVQHTCPTPGLKACITCLKSESGLNLGSCRQPTGTIFRRRDVINRTSHGQPPSKPQLCMRCAQIHQTG